MSATPFGFSLYSQSSQSAFVNSARMSELLRATILDPMLTGPLQVEGILEPKKPGIVNHTSQLETSKSEATQALPRPPPLSHDVTQPSALSLCLQPRSAPSVIDQRSHISMMGLGSEPQRSPTRCRIRAVDAGVSYPGHWHYLFCRLANLRHNAVRSL